MLAPALPANERERLSALCALRILDTPAEERFDRITRMAQRHFGVETALVSLVDAKRQWFKSRQGLVAAETPRDISFCGHAILGDGVFYVPDARADGRFADNPLVTGPPHVRFYAGAPLAAPGGAKVGTLCILDPRPKTLQEADLRMLRDLAACVERELAQEELRTLAARVATQEARLRAVLENVADGIATVDTERRIETFNAAAERIFGYAAAEVIGQDVKLLLAEAHHDGLAGFLGRRLAAGEVRVIGNKREVLGRRKDGSTFPLELAISEATIGGKRMLTGIVRDITERKKVDRMKAEFISTVSHELRTPLTSIQGALGLIRSGTIGSLPDKLARMLEIAYSNSGRLVRLINDILDSEKIAAGRMEFHMAPLDLGPLLEQAIEANRAYGAQFGVVFELVEAAAGARVVGDADRLMQVLANLLSNAAKFAPKDSRVELALRRHGTGFRVSVTDRGPGIPAEFRPQIFQRFAQADASDTRQKGGTGLGLSISRAIVRRHGGELGFESEPGRGTTFHLDLPEERSARPVAQAQASRPGRASRVLICEDNRDIATLLEMMLAEEGFDTDTAFTAAEAKALVARQRYDAMTLDIGLPDQDGIALLRELRGNERTRDLPVIVVSANSVPGLGDLEADQYGIVDWITKPIDPVRLAEDLQLAMRSSTGGRPTILHVEGDPHVVQVVAAVVGEFGEMVEAPTLARARELLAAGRFDLVILDLALPDGNGETLLPLLRGERGRPTPVIVFSAQDLSGEATRCITSALVKSRTSNEALLKAVRAAVGTGRTG